MSHKTIQLGDRVRDELTGFAGIVVVMSDFLWACRRICIQPEKLDKDKKVQESQWFDEPQVELVKVGVAGPLARLEKPTPLRRTGGPARQVAPSRDARR